jgi:hypothetical protein
MILPKPEKQLLNFWMVWLEGQSVLFFASCPSTTCTLHIKHV